MKKLKTGKKKTLEQVAFHEAGHAVMAWLLERKFKRVTIEPDPEGGGVKGDVLYKKPYITMVNGWQDWWLVDREIMIGFAGYISEIFSTGLSVEEFWEKGGGWWAGSSDDIDKAYELGLLICSDREEVTAYTGWLIIRVRNLLQDEINWFYVRRLAEELLKCRKISYRKVCRILHEARVELVKKAKEREKARETLSGCVEF